MTSVARRAFEFANCVVMRAKRYVHVRNCITRSIAPACDSCLQSFQRLLALLHASVSDRQTEPWPPGEFSCLLVECNRIIETPHLAIQCCERRLTIMGKSWVKLECPFSGCDRFVVKTEIAIELACEVAHPKRGWIDLRCALQVGQRLVAITARSV